MVATKQMEPMMAVKAMKEILQKVNYLNRKNG
jgi:hypothetical protein